MNRKIFTGLIIMMVFSIIGITGVQIVWIKNAVDVRNDNFNHVVITSISKAANDVQASRKMEIYNDFMFSGADLSSAGQDNISGYISEGSVSVSSEGSISVRITNQSMTSEPGKAPVIVSRDTIITSTTGDLKINDDRSDIGIVLETPDSALSSSGKVYVQQKDFIDWVRKRQDEFRNYSNRMISEIYQWEKTMEMDPREIEFALKRSLLFSGINTPFEFAIIRNGEVAEGIFNKSAKNDFLKSRYMVRLFPDNIIRQDVVLSVVFPERANYVLGSMAWILGGSLLFSLFILATFALSLFFIIRQKKISEMKSDFINNMTHEFKTPIATISLAADTITNPKIIRDEMSIRHFIGMIKKENSRMNKKVETILQIASLDKKEIDFRFEKLSVHSLIEKAVDTVEILVIQREGKIKMHFKATESQINGDPEHLFNLINNLLDNAIKYSEGAPQIDIYTADANEGIVLSVEDKGIGMSKSVQSRIFERFYRQTSGNVHDIKGFGLGLNYVRAIVDAHKGNISVISEPGKGSRFDVYLPYNPDNQQ